MPSAVWYAGIGGIKENLRYKYDSCGNICEITENGILAARYGYDGLNRLVREDNKKFKKTWLYAYDSCGNITSKREFAFTLRDKDKLEELESEDETFVYYGDCLAEIRDDSITYDSYGNPTWYKEASLEWEYGKRLIKYGETSFTYDGYGRRIIKDKIAFTYGNDGNLIKQTDGTNTLEFIYDNSGVCGFKYAGENYLYRKNAQGDITAILSANGSVLVRYDYDAWGNCKVEGNLTLGELNPFRYRGYYYDTETGLYFLQTRYYDPEVGRFISQDDVSYFDPEHINGLNLYAYCGNNPVMNVDPDGQLALSFILVSMLIGAIIGGTVAGVKASNAGLDAGGIALAVLGGVIMGAAVSGAFALGGAAVTGLTIFGKAVSISGVALYAIASSGTAVAGFLNYCCASAAYDIPINFEGAYASAFDGFIEGSFSFVMGMFAGSKGYFKNADKSIFKSSKVIETISRLVKFNLPSTIIRGLFKGGLQYGWGVKW